MTDQTDNIITGKSTVESLRRHVVTGSKKLDPREVAPRAEKMRLTRNWGGNRLPIHLCLLDKECWRDYREYYMPMRLHLHFLKHKDGHPVYITVWGGRRSKRWLEELFADESNRVRVNEPDREG